MLRVLVLMTYSTKNLCTVLHKTIMRKEQTPPRTRLHQPHSMRGRLVRMTSGMPSVFVF
jgi:hypothetical protein